MRRVSCKALLLIINRFPWTATALPVALALAGRAFGQEPAPDASNNEIVVTGAGLPETPAAPAYDVQMLDRKALMRTGSGRIEDALSSVAGFQQFRRSDSRSSNPSAQGVTLRGLGGNATSRALVLLDGVPMTDPFFGYVPLAALAPERLAGARVIRGGGSGPFGAGALSGTIELTSADAATLGTVSGQLLANDRGETEASATLASTLGQGFTTLSGRWDRGMGFHTTPRSQRVPATARAAFDSWSVQLRGVAPLTDTIEVQARGLIYADNRTLRFRGADSSSSAQDASLRLVGRGKWQFDLIGYVQARNFTNIVISTTRFVPVLDQYNTPSTGIGGKFELRPPLGGGHVLRIGADYRRASGSTNEVAFNAVSRAVTARRSAGGVNSDLGFFVENDWTIGALTLTAGARADRYTITDGMFREFDGAGGVVLDARYADRAGWRGSFRGGAVLRLGEALSVRAAAYTGLRLPTLNELYRPFVVFPVTTNANPALQNERLRGFEAGLDLTPASGVRLGLTAFDNRISDAIANVTVATNVRQRRNIDAISARGLELSAAVERRSVSLSGSLAYIDAHARGSGLAAALDGNRPAQTPRLSLSTTLAVRPWEDAEISATLRHVGRQFEDDLESDSLPAATTLDMYAGIPIGGRVKLVLRGENLTGERIVTRNQGGSIDLGAPRTFWAGIGLGL